MIEKIEYRFSAGLYIPREDGRTSASVRGSANCEKPGQAVFGKEHGDTWVKPDSNETTPIRVFVPSRRAPTVAAITWFGSICKLWRNTIEKVQLVFQIEFAKRFGATEEDREKARLVGRLVAGKNLAGAGAVAHRIAQLHGTPRFAQTWCAVTKRLVANPVLQEIFIDSANFSILGEWLDSTHTMRNAPMSYQRGVEHTITRQKRAAVILRQLEGGEALAHFIEGDWPKLTAMAHVIAEVGATLEQCGRNKKDSKKRINWLPMAHIGRRLEETKNMHGRDRQVTAELFERMRVAAFEEDAANRRLLVEDDSQTDVAVFSVANLAVKARGRPIRKNLLKRIKVEDRQPARGSFLAKSAASSKGERVLRAGNETNIEDKPPTGDACQAKAAGLRGGQYLQHAKRQIGVLGKQATANDETQVKFFRGVRLVAPED